MWELFSSRATQRPAGKVRAQGALLPVLPLQALPYSKAQEIAGAHRGDCHSAQANAYGDTDARSFEDQERRDNGSLSPGVLAGNARIAGAEVREVPPLRWRFGVSRKRGGSPARASWAIHFANVALAGVERYRRREDRGYSVGGRSPRFRLSLCVSRRG